MDFLCQLCEIDPTITDERCDSRIQLQMSHVIYIRAYISIKLRVEITHYEIKMSMMRFI
jgi:hypothetical protein